MSGSLQILICDDQEARRARWLESLQAIPELRDRLAPIDFDIRLFQEDYRALKRRRTEARPAADGDAARRSLDLARLAEREDPATRDDTTIFDRADILVVDYALELLEGDEGYLTGALVAYLARCYSGCGVIVGVNQYGENPFDLTLTGDKNSFADVDVGESQLANPGLWGPWDGGFRPWSWPLVPELHRLLRERARVAESHLAVPVLELLGLTDLVPVMARSALQDLERQGSRVEETTLEQLARTPALGLRRGEHPMSIPALARVAAARVTRWLESAVLPLQDVLTDAPHLAARNAALLAGPVDVAESWAATCGIGADLENCGLVEDLDRYRFAAALWTTRPTWRWPDLIRDDGLPGIADPWAIPTTELVFCEDLSRFVPRAHARRLVMEVGSNTTRWVADPGAIGDAGLEFVDYQPRRRLSL